MAFKTLFKRARRSVTMFLILSAVWAVVVHFDLGPDYLNHLLLALLAVAAVHMADRAYLYKDILEQFKEFQESATENFTRELERVTGESSAAIHEAVDKSSALVAQARKCGLTQVYQDRETARSDILAAIRSAKSDVWLQGVTFQHVVSLDDVLTILKPRLPQISKEGRPKLRLLLLDGLRTSALLRTILECDRAKATGILKTPATDESAYFDRTLYRDFEKTVRTISDNTVLKDKARFYSHDPIFWMVLVDDTVFIEPYAFGRGRDKEGQDITPLGGQMPVFRFSAMEGPAVYDVLRDHFHKVWLMSDTDLFHVRSRDIDKGRVIGELFGKRKTWVKRLVGVLYPDPSRKEISGVPDADDPRRCPRRPCETKGKLGLRWNGGSPRCELVGDVIQSAYDMVELAVRREDGLPACGEEVVLFDPYAEGVENSDDRIAKKSSEFMIRQLLQEGRIFKVVRIIPGPEQPSRRIVAKGRSAGGWASEEIRSARAQAPVMGGTPKAG